MAKTSLKQNLILNTVYHVLVLAVPLLTTPYLSRVLGAEGIGEYSYTYSIVSYFVLFVMLGVNTYGNRQIAVAQNDAAQRSKSFWNIYCMQFVRCVLVTTIYVLCSLLIFCDYSELLLIWLVYLLSAGLDITWFFFGLEQFKITVTRNTIVKLLTLIAIFLFVKTQDDLVIYVTIMAVGFLVSQLTLWMLVKKYVAFVKPSMLEMLKHLKPELVLFIPVLAFNLYSVIGKVGLGALSSMFQLGLYANAEKIVLVSKAVITALGSVMLPRQSAMISENKIEKSKELLALGMLLAAFISFFCMAEIAGCAEDFSPLFFGEEFAECANILTIYVFAIPFVAFSNVIRMQYLIPSFNERVYVHAVVAAAVVSILMNVVLIPIYGAIGATIAIVCSEATVFLVQTLGTIKKLDYKRFALNSIPFVLAGIMSYLVMRVMCAWQPTDIFSLLLEIVVGALVYFLAAFGGSFVMNKEVNSLLISLFSRKRGIK